MSSAFSSQSNSLSCIFVVADMTTSMNQPVVAQAAPSVQVASIPSKIQCFDCGRTFSRLSNLKRHLESLHWNERTSANVRCVECNKVFSDASNFRNHVRSVHWGEKPFLCTYAGCSQKFFHKNALNQHISEVHRSIKPFNCKECQEPFARKSHLEAHAAFCGRSKDLVCSLCSQSFNSKFDITLHELINQHCRGDNSSLASQGDHVSRLGGRSYDKKSDSKAAYVLNPNCARTFVSLEDVLMNKVTHSTTPEACEAILNAKRFQGMVLYAWYIRLQNSE